MRLLISLFVLTATVPAGTITYNAALGTLPTDQGFTLNDSTPGPAPSVTFGNLNQGPTPGSGFQFWYRSGLGLNFAAGDTVELTGRFRVITSGLLTA